MNDFSEVAFKMKRLPFGLRFSPSVLMVALYIILVLHCYVGDPFEIHLRNMLYTLSYMDNLAFSTNDENDLLLAFHKSITIFSEYGIELQQFATNLESLEKDFPEQFENTSEYKLLGLVWLKNRDHFALKKMNLNPEASTLRLILSSLNSCYDPLGFCLPLKNRAKLFVHELQMDANVTWDSDLGGDRVRERRKICKSCNIENCYTIPRFIGQYEDIHDLVGFTDASKNFYGCVLYLKNLKTNQLHFLAAKNKIVASKGLSCTIPVLELFAVHFGVETLIDMYNNLTKCHCKININKLELFTDSMISLNWLTAKACKTNKIEKKGTVVMNKLNNVMKLCETHSIIFHHIAGVKNPADMLTRVVSPKSLAKSNYLTGPDLHQCSDGYFLEVPHNSENDIYVQSNSIIANRWEPIIALDRYSSIDKTCRVLHYVRKYIHALKLRVQSRKPHLFHSLSAVCPFKDSCTFVYRRAQQINFSDTYNYLLSPTTNPATNIVNQLNLFLDNEGIVRVKSKFGKLNAKYNEKYPLLLAKNCPLTKNLIFSFHIKTKHSGVYKVLSLLKKEFYIPSSYMTVKKVLHTCLICKKLFGRTVNININDYRDFRISPKEIPYNTIALDHVGPFHIKINNNNEKIYVLIVTCLWSRHVNLLICLSINKESFMNAFQTHVYEYGIPETILSDAGSSIVTAFSVIKNFLNDTEVNNFLKEKNISVMNFQTYPPNASYLGSVVESLVKQLKFMVYSTIAKNVLPFEQFCLLIREINMIINKRPIAFKNLLSHDNEIAFSPCPLVLTPEIVLKGYDVPSIVIAPHLHISQDNDNDDPEWLPKSEQSDQHHLFKAYKKYQKVKGRMHNLYHDEFLSNLRDLSTNRVDRYKKKKHTKLCVGDVVVIAQKYTKPYFYPPGMVTAVKENELGEVVEVTIKKSNGEEVIRHVTDIILIKSAENTD